MKNNSRAVLASRMLHLLVVCAALMLPLLGECAPTVLDWSEEVKLHDGRIIVIKRHDEIGASGFPLSHRGPRKYWQFCYAPMGIQWKSKPGYFPETFDIVDGKAYVRVTISSCEQCMLHGYPDTSALYFVWEGNAWKKIEYKEFPPGLRVNMLNGTHYDDDGSRDVRGVVTIAQKEHLDAEIYWIMRKKPEIVGLNDWVTYPGPNKPPRYARDACKECRSVHVQTTNTAEIFLPASRKDCN